MLYMRVNVLFSQHRERSSRREQVHCCCPNRELHPARSCSRPPHPPDLGRHVELRSMTLAGQAALAPSEPRPTVLLRVPAWSEPRPVGRRVYTRYTHCPPYRSTWYHSFQNIRSRSNLWSGSDRRASSAFLGANSPTPRLGPARQKTSSAFVGAKNILLSSILRRTLSHQDTAAATGGSKVRSDVAVVAAGGVWFGIASVP